MANLKRGIERDEQGNVTAVRPDRHLTADHPDAVQVTEEGPRNVLEDRHGAAELEKLAADEQKEDERRRKEAEKA